MGSQKSQSLIHQVIYSVWQRDGLFCACSRYASQSLIHQVIYSVPESKDLMRKGAPKSQSLIHQVIYSVRLQDDKGWDGKRASLNPLFIRSSIPFLPAEILQALRLDRKSQSLIHQVIYSVRIKKRFKAIAESARVSIPYSSGHLFRSDLFEQNFGSSSPAVSIPYSSGHLFR